MFQMTGISTTAVAASSDQTLKGVGCGCNESPAPPLEHSNINSSKATANHQQKSRISKLK